LVIKFDANVCKLKMSLKETPFMFNMTGVETGHLKRCPVSICGH
jgi:hypothetical protein